MNCSLYEGTQGYVVEHGELLVVGLALGGLLVLDVVEAALAAADVGLAASVPVNPLLTGERVPPLLQVLLSLPFLRERGVVVEVVVAEHHVPTHLQATQGMFWSHVLHVKEPAGARCTDCPPDAIGQRDGVDDLELATDNPPTCP